jgi:hypothetical protein
MKTIAISENVDFDWLEKQLENISFLNANSAPSAADLTHTLVDLSITKLKIEHNKMLIKFPKNVLTLEEVVIFTQGLNANEMEAISDDCISLWWD